MRRQRSGGVIIAAKCLMTVQLPLHMDKAAFLAWAEGRQERYELVEGPAVMMTRPRCAHAIIVGNLIVALRRRRDSRKWAVIAGFGLDAGPRTLRFPDIVVDRMGGTWMTAGPPVPSCSPRCFQVQPKGRLGGQTHGVSTTPKPRSLSCVCAARGEGMGMVA